MKNDMFAWFVLGMVTCLYFQYTRSYCTIRYRIIQRLHLTDATVEAVLALSFLVIRDSATLQ